MRILTVSHFYESHGGGIERVAGHLCRAFARHGATAVWAASDADPPPHDGTQTVPLGCIDPAEALTGLPMPLPGPRAVRALLREVARCDAVVIHDALYVTSILALIMARLRRKRVVLVQHIAGIAFASPVLRGVMALANVVVTRSMIRAADELVFISDTVRRDLIGHPPNRDFRLLFNGVDGAIFHPGNTGAPSAAVVAGPGLPHRDRRILFVGRYVEKKGLAILRALAAARPDLSIMMAGTGPINPAGWGLGNMTDLGPQTPAALAELYRQADILLLPSVGEGYPLVIQEAMASALPVICGAPSHQADPDAGQWLHGVDIDLSNPVASAARCAAVIDFLNVPPDSRSAMAAYAARRYDWDAMAAGVLDAAGMRALP